jgi:sporulation protein YlmC with PRC-barrel domain
MRIVEELQGKIIVDAKGNEVGKADDVEIDLETRSLAALVVKGKGMLAKQFQAEKLASMMKRLRVTKTEDLLIPFDDVQVIGKYVILKNVVEQGNAPSTS